MPDAPSTRLAVSVDLVSASPIEGSDEMLVTLRTASDSPLTLRLTRPEAAELVRMIQAERALGRSDPKPCRGARTPAGRGRPPG